MKNDKSKKPMKKSAAPVVGLPAALAALREKLPGRVMFIPPVSRVVPMRHRQLGILLAGPDTPGLPAGKFIEILGEAHSGKTTLAFAMADAVINQPQGTKHSVRDESGKYVEVEAPRRVLYLDFEHAVNMKYLRDGIRNAVIAEPDEKGVILNSDTANLWIHQPETLEEGAEAAVQLIGSGEFGMIVIDSVPAMLPIEERNKSMEESTVGKHAQAIGKFFRRTVGLTARFNVVVVLVNQWRDKIGVSFGDPRRAPGGKAMTYYDSLKIDVSGPKGSPWFPEGGKMANVNVMKNKVTGKLGKVSYHLGAGWGISAEVELTEMLQAAGLLNSTGPNRPVTVFPNLPTRRVFESRDAWLRHLRNGSDKQWASLTAMCVKAGVSNVDKPSRSSSAFDAEGD